MATTQLRREALINGSYVRFADVLRWAANQPPEVEVDPAFWLRTDADALVGYLLHRAAIDRVGRGGVVVNRRVNTWSRDGSAEDIEVTVGRRADPATGATWTDCTSYWLHWRKWEIEPAAEAFALYRRFRQADDDLYTERVEVDHYARGGGPEIETDRFWIAYPPHIAGYADDDYRISHAWGRGPTKTAALLAAIELNERR